MGRPWWYDDYWEKRREPKDEFAEHQERQGKGRRPRGGGRMLRLPVKIILLCISLVAVVLGSHGLYVYFSRLELLFGGEASKLFLSFEMPVRIAPVVEWMSLKGLQSWFIPAVFVVVGLVIGSCGWKISTGGSNVLRKLHLW